MKRATSVIAKDDARIGEAVREITLTREDRYKRRITWQTDCGLEFLLDLEEPTYLPNGSGLALDDGSVIRVKAAAEALLKVTAHDPVTLTRITWHIGNRHTPAEITADAIYILPDHVLAEMVRGLGGHVTETSRPFEPEGGAYGGHGTLERGHHHHGHEHDHTHGHSPSQTHPHEH